MMRELLVPIVVTAALVAAVPASAQRASLGERVAALEQQAANQRGNTDLLDQVGQLRTEVQALRAQLEELQQQNELFRQSARSQYLDLDGRLTRLEGGAPPAAPTTRDAAPVAATLPALPAASGDERSAYGTAFDALKAGRYADSARLFQAFLQAYPNGSYAPNALYWLGESYYVTQNYALAEQQFQGLLERYPTHDKAPGAVLKVGLAQVGLQQLDAAERTLAEVATRYPGSDAARTADDRLRAIQLGRVR
jgi:tol-pal system protein YbgF